MRRFALGRPPDPVLRGATSPHFAGNLATPLERTVEQAETKEAGTQREQTLVVRGGLTEQAAQGVQADGLPPAQHEQSLDGHADSVRRGATPPQFAERTVEQEKANEAGTQHEQTLVVRAGLTEQAAQGVQAGSLPPRAPRAEPG